MEAIRAMIQRFNEANKEQLAIWGDAQFDGISPALLRIRKAKILFNEGGNGVLDWYLVLWRAGAIRTLCASAGVCPYPLLLALLYWPLVDTTPEERAEQLRTFKHQLETTTVERIIEHADVWGIESNDLLCQLFGLGQFGLGTVEDDAKFWLAVAVEWGQIGYSVPEKDDAGPVVWKEEVSLLQPSRCLRTVVRDGSALSVPLNDLLCCISGKQSMDGHLRYYRRFLDEIKEAEPGVVANHLEKFGW